MADPMSLSELRTWALENMDNPVDSTGQQLPEWEIQSAGDADPGIVWSDLWKDTP